MVSRFPGHPPAPGQHPDPGDPCVPGERPAGARPEEALRPGAEEPPAGRVSQGKSFQKQAPPGDAKSWELGTHQRAVVVVVVVVVGSNSIISRFSAIGSIPHTKTMGENQGYAQPTNLMVLAQRQSVPCYLPMC